MQLSNFVIIFIIAHIEAASAAVASGFFTDSEHPGQCVLKDQGLILSPGDRVPQKGHCSSILCGDNGFVIFSSCGVLAVPDGCRIKEPLDPKAIYPYCCPSDISCNHISMKN